MNRIFPVEIRNFPSLSELSTYIEKGISWYGTFLKGYNENLGELLREQGGNAEELEKRLREKGLARQSGKKNKKKGASSSEEWFSYKGLMFSAEKQNKAEIFFEAVDKIKTNLERLKETKTLIEELRKIGLGSDLVYSVYFVDGVPEKIFVEPAGKAAPKYKLEMFLSTSMESFASIMQPEETQATSEETEASEEKTADNKDDAEKAEQPKQEKSEKKSKGKRSPANRT